MLGYYLPQYTQKLKLGYIIYFGSVSQSFLAHPLEFMACFPLVIDKDARLFYTQ